MTFLDPATVPITHFDGLSLPPIDPNFQAAAPVVTPDTDQALNFVTAKVPDEGTPAGPISRRPGPKRSSAATLAINRATRKCRDGAELWGLPPANPRPIC